MSYYNMQFIHKPLVQVKIGGISVSLYPMPDALMLAAKRAHGLQVLAGGWRASIAMRVLVVFGDAM